jgi:hypothetical protein
MQSYTHFLYMNFIGYKRSFPLYCGSMMPEMFTSRPDTQQLWYFSHDSIWKGPSMYIRPFIRHVLTDKHLFNSFSSLKHSLMCTTYWMNAVTSSHPRVNRRLAKIRRTTARNDWVFKMSVHFCCTDWHTSASKVIVLRWKTELQNKMIWK